MDAQIVDQQELELCIPEGVEVCVTTSDSVEVVELEQIEELLAAGGSTSATTDIEIEEEHGHFECEICGLVLSTKSVFDQHKQQIHVDEAFYACEFCSATRIHWTEFYVHQCTNPDSTPLVCPQCHQTVSTKKQLNIHEEVHALQRRFTTKKLNNYFTRKLEEAEDPAIDWGLKPFICGICGKPFAKLYEVEYHEKLHTEERPANLHSCARCGMNYLNKNDLNKHAARGCIQELSRKTAPPPKT